MTGTTLGWNPSNNQEYSTQESCDDIYDQHNRDYNITFLLICIRIVRVFREHYILQRGLYIYNSWSSYLIN